MTSHPGETVILLMSPAIGAMLWFGWPRVRRRSWLHYVHYLLIMGGIIAGAQLYIASIVRGRVSPAEVFWALYFLVAWRFAWSLWSRTVGRIGEARRRAARRRIVALVSNQCDVPQVSNLSNKLLRFLIPTARITASSLIFAPLLVGSLIHRCKIGNAPDHAGYGAAVQDVSFVTADGLRLSGWFLPEPHSNRTVVLSHGLGANKGNFADYFAVFSGRGYSCLIFDFRGHGDSAGHTTTFGLLETADVRAAVDWLKRAHPQQAHHVVGWGSSMGAMALVREAADDPRIEAVVLDSCFASAAGLAHQHCAKIPLIGGSLAELALTAVTLNAGHSLWQLDATGPIARIAPRPILLIHGSDDTLISPSNLDELFAAAREPKQRWLGPGPHSNVMTTDFEAYQSRVINFFNGALKNPQKAER